jgi:hypothetical protein
MAARLPLVLVNGELQLLQPGDTLARPAVSFGVGNPDNANGSNGDLYFNTVQGDLWNKQAGAWVLYGANAYYIQGKGVDPGAPTNGYVLTYDSALFSGAGGWKAAAASAGSVDDATLARLNLAIL